MLTKIKNATYKEIKWENYSKILKQHSIEEARKINRIVKIIAVIGIIELLSIPSLFIWIFPWWISIILGYIIWVLLIKFNMNVLYILFITYFRENKLMMSMVKDAKRWTWKN